MHYSEKGKEDLRYHYEVLIARLYIREFFTKHIVKEVYENIGQVLSLVRIQLSALNTEVDAGEFISSGDLVAQSIIELRTMCKSFYPDHDLMREEGLVEGIERTIKILFQNAVSVNCKGASEDLDEGKVLLLFKMFLEILLSIKKSGGEYRSTDVSFNEGIVHFRIRYVGSTLSLEKEIAVSEVHSSLDFYDRIKLVDGRFGMKHNKKSITINMTAPVLRLDLWNQNNS